MNALYLLLLVAYITSLFTQCVLIVAYTLTPSESITDGKTLTSQGEFFELGFFSPSITSKKRYLGIWYKTISKQTVVWVANRNSPIYDRSGVLKISSTGDLHLSASKTAYVIWSTNITNVVKNPIVEFLESGNLVVRDSENADPESYLWQSFDYPTDTFMAGMKLGWNQKTGVTRYISSWKNIDDPSLGEYTFGIKQDGYPEFMMQKGQKNYYRAGLWNGLQAQGVPEFTSNPLFTDEYISNEEETYFTFRIVNHSIIMRFVIRETNAGGFCQLMTWVDKIEDWVVQLMIPKDHCDGYATCGSYGSCDISTIDVCQCLQGFKPKSPDDWRRFDWSKGCERQVPLQCNKGEGFRSYTGLKLPEATASTWVNASMSLEECEVMCLKNCSCMAYSNLDVNEGGSGCMLWFDELIDMRNLKGAKPTLYIRMSASELVSEARARTNKHVILIISIALVVGFTALGLSTWCMWKKRSLKGATKKDGLELPLFSKRDDPELPLFDFDTIISATNNFSEENKLGQGGFGAVYKGIVDGKEEIAVKRLSKNSVQGINEFKNEVILISKIQHRNLVRILGCCIQRDEMMLIYEYMHNNSLDSFIFDAKRSRLLDWKMRSHIISCIARGLLYLHHDSRLRIIHRDLKGSNVLLNREMVAKISDFGLARIFGGDEIEGRTKRVVGTRGYMSPEYAFEGHFSVRSDVFAFGVLVLEIISGKRNWGFSHPEHEINLLGHAWRLWKADKCMDLVDESMENSGSDKNISRCIHIGLLCVQNDTNQRPNMSSVVLMLSSETSILPEPQPPGFYIERRCHSEEKRAKRTCISYDDCITLFEAR